MEKLSIGELIKAIGGEFLIGDPYLTVQNISIDSRTLSRGDFYFAIKGKKLDGHTFIKQAIEKGAGGIVISEGDFEFGNAFPQFPAVIRVPDTTRALGDLGAYYRKKWNIPVVAITGSNGKTTTKQMLFSILSKKGETLCNRGNLNNLFGLPLTLFDISSSHKYVVVEMGTSLPGEISRLSEIASPDIGIITNIGYSHLQDLKNREGVFAEKKTLFDKLQKEGCAIINLDDEYLKNLVNEGAYEKISFGIKGKADIFGEKIEEASNGLYFDMNMFSKRTSVKLPVVGSFNVLNALAAAGAAWKLGIDIKSIKEGLESFTPPGMRMQPAKLSSGAILINDAYNSNPSSVREAITALVSNFPGTEKSVVLGDMLELGEGAGRFHSELGEFLDTQSFRKIYLFGPLMREAFVSIKHAPAVYLRSKSELLGELKKDLGGNSVTLFKASRGMALEDIFNSIVDEDRQKAS